MAAPLSRYLTLVHQAELNISQAVGDAIGQLCGSHRMHMPRDAYENVVANLAARIRAAVDKMEKGG